MIIHAIIFVLLAGAGVWAFLESRKKKARIKAAAGWPSVPGKILTCEVQRHEQSNGSTSGGRDISYTVEATYSYDYQGQSRTGSRLFVGDNKVYSTLGGAKKAAAELPVGGAVNVHIDPADPSNTALTVGGGTNISVAIIFWVIAVISLFINGRS